MAIYVFGNFNKGYVQYPNDSTSNTFKNIYSNCKATTQIAIHRDGNLMYYCYIRNLNNRKYIGICNVLTGKYLTKVDELFPLFENIIEIMVNKGDIIHFTETGEITTSLDILYQSGEDIALVSEKIESGFNSLSTHTKQLPPTDFSIAKGSVISYSVNDLNSEIVKASYTFSYTFIYKDKDYNTIHINSYKGVIARKEKEISELKTECSELKRNIVSLKNKQRNTTWVAILGIVAFILFGIVYVEVINPSEVTKKDMGDFVYYGPMQSGEPNGVGVAIYHSDDKDGRLYYYGNFTNGKRIAEDAIMFYKDGSYFKGSMDEDKWRKGIFFDVEKEHFIGEFKNNKPWNGDWYKHVHAQTITDGQ